MSELTRTVVGTTKIADGSAPDHHMSPSRVEVTVTVRYLPYGENELIAHYLTNQAAREVVAKIDAQGMARLNDEDAAKV